MKPSKCNADPTRPFGVLVVSRNPRHAKAVRQTVTSWRMTARVTAVADVMAAVRSVLSSAPDLVVVDWAVDAPGGQALVRQLARLNPHLAVLAFDEAGVAGPGDSPQAWPWDELPAVLNRWLMLTLDHEASAGRRS